MATKAKRTTHKVGPFQTMTIVTDHGETATVTVTWRTEKTTAAKRWSTNNTKVAKAGR